MMMESWCCLCLGLFVSFSLVYGVSSVGCRYGAGARRRCKEPAGRSPRYCRRRGRICVGEAWAKNIRWYLVVTLPYSRLSYSAHAAKVTRLDLESSRTYWDDLPEILLFCIKSCVVVLAFVSERWDRIDWLTLVDCCVNFVEFFDFIGWRPLRFCFDQSEPNS
jgi:hypothetical protein